MQSLELESSLVAAVGNVVLGLAVLLRRPGARTYRAFAWLSLSIAVWNAGDFGYGLSDPDARVWWHRLVFAGSMAIPPAALHLVRGLTGRGRDWTWRYLHILLVQFAVVLALLFTPLFPRSYQIIAAVYQFSNLGLCLALLLLRIPRAGPLEKRQLRYLFVGGLLATVLGATDYLATRLPVPRLGAPAILLYLCLVSAAIGRHHLFAARRLFGRWVAILVVAFAVAALVQLVDRFQPRGRLAESLVPLLIGVLAVALYDPLRESLRLYRSRARKEGEELSERIAGLSRSLLLSPRPDRWQENLLAGLRSIPQVEEARYLPLDGAGGLAAPEGGWRASLLEGAEEAGPWERLLAESPSLAPARGKGFNILLPVQDRERLHGVVALSVLKPHLHLEPEHLDLLTLLGTEAGLIQKGVEQLRWIKRQEELSLLGEMAVGVAHEVRNPLGAIRGAVDLLAERPGDRPERFLTIIREEVDRLDRFLGDFLAFGRPGRLNVEPLDLARLAREASEVVALRPRTPPVALAGGGPVEVRGDRARLKSVLLNLLLNAAQFAGPQGRVEALVERQPAGGATVRVRDTGPGIPPEVLPRLFRPFFTTRQGGTGLGLAICARMVDLHGGTISAGNWRDGAEGGAEFVVLLPAAPPREEGKAPEERRD